jgi:molybdopterin synthase sulfur carrier subunit
MKKITIRYFARLREQLGVEQETVELPESIESVAQLKTLLTSRGETWQKAMTSAPSILAAVNQTMASQTQTIQEGDEVAFFPPLTGG